MSISKSDTDVTNRREYWGPPLELSAQEVFALMRGDRLASMLQSPVEQVNVEQVVQLVSYDSSIAAQCLRTANSPLFGRRNVETVRSASERSRAPR